MADSERPTTDASTLNAPGPPSVEDSSLFSPRSRKQFSIFLAGSYFCLISSVITRRAVTRRIQWAKPTFFRTNQQHPEQKIDGGLEALEAITVATVNVFSWGIMFFGGVLWATDTSGIEEMRSKLRLRLRLSEEEQKGSQEVVHEWVEAAKPWNAFKSQKKPETVDENVAETVAADDKRTNEREGGPS